jgi:predicted Zn-dependent protease
MPYSFHLVDDEHVVNAWALPGGPVYIGKGLLALMETEDALAAVLGHEVEHIDHYHCIDRYQSERMTRTVPVVGLVAQLPMAVFEAGYAKTQELEADADGVRLAARAGYAPLAVITLLEAMEQAKQRGRTSPPQRRRAGSPVAEALDLPAGVLDAYFRSHPPSSERVTQIRNVVRAERLDTSRVPRALEAPRSDAP